MLEVCSGYDHSGATGQSQTLNMPSTLMNPFTLAAQSSASAYSPSSLSFVPPGRPELKRSFSQDDMVDRVNLDEHETKSGKDMDGGSGEDQDAEQPSRKKRYHRHNATQIQQLESFFKECAHPDEKQRQELSEALGLSIRQVKFWFQNRRTQMKAQQERSDNAHLRGENDRLRTENITIREAIKNVSCPSCGGPSAVGDMTFDEQQLRVDNTRLREELERVSSMATRYIGRPVAALAGSSLGSPIPGSSLELAVGGATIGVGAGSAAEHHQHPRVSPLPQPQPSQQQGPTLLEIALRPGGISEMERGAVLDLAMTALEEVLHVVQAEEPLWVKSGGSSEARLDCDHYFKQFPGGIGPRPPGLATEASRENGLVIMNSVALLDALMDVDKWMEMFPTVISKALTVEVLSPGMGATLDGALQLMYAEFQVLSPLVQTREMYFLRYCKQAADKVWAVIDVSIDCLRDNPPPCLLQCRRRPSGCIVQDMPNGYSQVTWLEHVEADHRGVNRMFLPHVSSGTAFGARRWLCTLQRYCESLVSLLATNIPPRDLGVVSTLEGRRCMLRLAQKMMNRYCSNVSASQNSSWLSLPNSSSSGSDEDVRVMTRDNPGDGVLLCAATSMWLPFSRQRVFDFLRNERLRAQWDVLANGVTQEMSHIAKGQHPGNNVCLLRVNGSNPSQSNVLILQESCTDDSSSLVVYMPVDFSTLTRVLQGEDPSDMLLPPSGFVIVPHGPENRPTGLLLGEGIGMDNPNAGGGSILTVSFQIAVSHVPSSGKLNMDSVNTVSKIIISTLQHIKTALQRWDG